jgi:LacI family transcriptional regulator
LRLDGFRQALEAAGEALDPQLVQPGAFTFRSGVGAAERLLHLPDPPTAIFASNDNMALGVMAVAGRLQLQVPEQLSVVGFDDSPVAEAVWPQLTTIRQPLAEMARRAVEMLIQPETGQGGGERLAFELVERGSAGPLAQKGHEPRSGRPQ